MGYRKWGICNTMSPQEIKIQNLTRIYKALLKLLAETSLSDISVSRLCRTAKVSRTYYYRNYHSFQEIITIYQTNMIKSYLRILPHHTTMNFTHLMTAYFKLMQKNVTQTKLLVDAGLTSTLVQTFSDVYYFLSDQQIIVSPSDRQDYNDYFVSYMSGAVINVQMKWMNQGMKESPAQMGKMLNEFFFNPEKQLTRHQNIQFNIT
jgi:AcrR family transcriptional regulator